MSVVIIEDDLSLSNLMLAIFGRLGLDPEAVSRGDAAMQSIESFGERYSAIILDLMLPGLRGFEPHRD